MLIFDSLIGITILISAIVCGISIRSIRKYNDRHQLNESKYTKLFGVFSKEHVLGMYLVYAGIYALIGIFLMIYL